MQTGQVHTNEFEFYFPERDTLVLVEKTESEVIIRATRNTFSEARKASFVRELAAEGFVPESYHWFSESTPWLKLRWIVDITWLKPNKILAARTNRYLICFLAGALIIWLSLMAVLFVFAK